MGGDGGTTANERKYTRWHVKKQSGEKMSSLETNFYRLNTCALTGEPLKPPVCLFLFLYYRYIVVKWDTYIINNQFWNIYFQRSQNLNLRMLQN